MPRKALPDPYRSLTPWAGFTPRERKRAVPLPRCPSAQCRRTKTCCKAIDGLYCRRTHIAPEEVRTQARQRAVQGGAEEPARRHSWETLPARPSLEQVEAYRIASDMTLARAEAQAAQRLAQWKAGSLDHLYGRYDARGVWMTAPERRYVEEDGRER